MRSSGRSAGGVRFLLNEQLSNGGWSDFEESAPTGMTSLVTLALLTAGESPDSEPIRRALEYLRKFDPGRLDSVYSVSLQTMVFAAAKPREDIIRIQSNVDWLQEAQIVPGDHALWPGSWSYKMSKSERGDGSNAQYALLALNAAAEAGVRVRPEVWKRARDYWSKHQLPDGSWSYTPDGSNNSSASMTCAGVSSLVITGLKRFRGAERLVGDRGVEECGRGGSDPNLAAGINWLSTHFSVDQNFGSGRQWKYYYLYGLERTGRLSGVRFFGEPRLVSRGGRGTGPRPGQAPGGFWRRHPVRGASPTISTSFGAAVPRQGACAGADQQAPPRAGDRLEQRRGRCPEPRRGRLARLGPPPHLAGG